MWRVAGSKPDWGLPFFQQLSLTIARNQLSVLVVGKVGRGLRIRCITSSNLENGASILSAIFFHNKKESYKSCIVNNFNLHSSLPYFETLSKYRPLVKLIFISGFTYTFWFKCSWILLHYLYYIKRLIKSLYI